MKFLNLKDHGKIGPLWAVILVGFVMFMPVLSRGESLWLKNTHTGESFKGPYKKDGVYDSLNCLKIDQLLRDHRTNEVHKIDRVLLDYVFAIVSQIKRKTPEDVCVYVVSGYRSPKTNNMLRSRSSKVSKNSYHLVGKALDFFISSVPLTTLAAVAKSLRRGGVGHYPASGFIHIDTGRVRSW